MHQFRGPRRRFSIAMSISNLTTARSLLPAIFPRILLPRGLSLGQEGPSQTTYFSLTLPGLALAKIPVHLPHRSPQSPLLPRQAMSFLIRPALTLHLEFSLGAMALRSTTPVVLASRPPIISLPMPLAQL